MQRRKRNPLKSSLSRGKSEYINDNIKQDILILIYEARTADEKGEKKREEEIKKKL